MADSTLNEKKKIYQKLEVEIMKVENQLKDSEQKKQSFEDAKVKGEMNQKDLKKMMSYLTPFLKKVGMEDALLAGLPVSLNKADDARSRFDNVIISEVSERMQLFIKKQTDEINQKKEESSAPHSEFEQAERVFDHASACLVQTKEEIDALEKEIQEASRSVKSKDKEKKNHKKHMQDNEDLHDENMKRVTLLNETRAKFESFCNRENPRPVLEEEEKPQEVSFEQRQPYEIVIDDEEDY